MFRVNGPFTDADLTFGDLQPVRTQEASNTTASNGKMIFVFTNFLMGVVLKCYAAGSMRGIGIKTVEKHREHLMAKLGIHDTAGLTRYAISTGIIESSVQ